MATVTKKTLVLGFTTSSGESLKLTINNPVEGMDGSRISMAMEGILASNAFGEESVATNKATAKYVIQEVDEVELV